MARGSSSTSQATEPTSWTNKERIEDLEMQTSQFGEMVPGLPQLMERMDALEASHQGLSCGHGG